MRGAVHTVPVGRIVALQLRHTPTHPQSAEHVHVGICVRLERIKQSSVPVEQHMFYRGLIFHGHRNRLRVINKIERLSSTSFGRKQSSTEFAGAAKRVKAY